MADNYRRGDRDRERDRERGPKDDNVEYFGGGESYRPGGHSGQGPYRPPHANRDTWNADRRDREPREPRESREPREPREPRRERDPRREDIDSYIPPTSNRARKDSPSPSYRPRSRSPPPPRDRGDLFPDHTRSPARRFSPRRDERQRAPSRRRSRSPISRNRSPDRRTRDYSPPRSPRRGRSPRFDRARSPRRNYSPPRDARRYRSRSRSPRKNAYNDDSWRRRSPSPRADSSAPSRRSSPPVHPDRVSISGSVPRSPAYYGTPPADSRPNGDFAPPSGPGGARNGYDRPPPSGPSRAFSSSQTPPTGPRGPSAPSAPRGGRPDGPRRDFNPALRGRTSLTYRAPTAPRAPTYGEGGIPPTGPSGSAPPSGPRASSYSSRSDYNVARASYPSAAPARQDYAPFRGTNSTSSSSTYPRTQRFNTTQQHLQTTEKIVPGGKLLPSGLSTEQEKKMRQLEADAERLRADIEEKQVAKREVLGEWDVRERESSREGYRSELAEEGLKKLAGEERMAAF